MNPKIIPSLALVLGGIVFSTRPAKAQPGLAIYHSLEARVAQAQSVVRGTISNCSGHFIERQSGYYGGHQEDGTQRPNGVMKYTITVQVDEVIKGKAARTIELVQETFVDDKRFEQWADHHTSFLWFFGDKTWSNLGGHDPQWSTIRLGEAVPAERGFSSDQPVYLMDFSPLADPKEILARTRRFAKNLGEASPQFHTLARLFHKLVRDS